MRHTKRESGENPELTRSGNGERKRQEQKFKTSAQALLENEFFDGKPLP